MSRFHQSRAAAHRARALALTVAAMLACACGDDDNPQDEGDASQRDAAVRSDGGDAGRDASSDGGRDGGDGAVADAGPTDPAMPGEDLPVLMELEYLNEGMGASAMPVIVFAGRDPNGDVSSYEIKLFKGSNPAEIVIDSEGATATELTGNVPEDQVDPTNASFRFWITSSVELLTKVDRIEATVLDKGGRRSMPAKMAMLRTRTINGGQPCFPEGYPRCAANYSCIAGANAKFICSPSMTARTQACASPLELHPPQVASVTGELSTASLWDPPASCSAGDPEFFPDRLIKLRLDNAATVVVSSNNPGTNFDSVLYKLESCQMAPAMCTASPCGFCEDDVITSGTMTDRRAVLTLNNLPAGEHLIVIDSRGQPDDMGDSFEVTATIQ